jgi:hypothetical protein
MKEKKRLGARSKLRSHFLANIGRVMSSHELSEASGGTSEWRAGFESSELKKATRFSLIMIAAILSPDSTFSRTPNRYQLSSDQSQRNCALSFWIGMALRAKCAVR